MDMLVPVKVGNWYLKFLEDLYLGIDFLLYFTFKFNLMAP